MTRIIHPAVLRIQLRDCNSSYLGIGLAFSLSIRIENNETPAMSLEHDTISFANRIKAEFDFDHYIY